MKQEERKNGKTGSNKGLWIGGGICLAIVLLVVAILALSPLISAEILRGDVEERLEQEGEVRVVLTDPKQSGDALFSTAEVVITGEEAVTLRDQLLGFLQNSSYEETTSSLAGVWSTSATVYIGDGQTRLYLDEDHIRLEKDEKVISYEPKDAYEDAFESLYRQIRQRLS